MKRKSLVRIPLSSLVRTCQKKKKKKVYLKTTNVHLKTVKIVEALSNSIKNLKQPYQISMRLKTTNTNYVWDSHRWSQTLLNFIEITESAPLPHMMVLAFLLMPK
jgi:hypothetical protein